MNMQLKVKRLHPDAILPTYGAPGAAWAARARNAPE
jgi:hypothetical protein